MNSIKILKNPIKTLKKLSKMVETSLSLSIQDYLKSKQPPLIEGPDPDKDISYSWVLKNAELNLIEQGIFFDELAEAISERNLDMEFRVDF